MHHHLSTGTDGDSYRVVFIGNSITLHGLTDYWWGEWGMAASDADHDYVHQTVTELGRKYRVNADVLNFAVWETNGHDRGEMLTLLDQFLNDDVDLYVVQLGENVTDTNTLEQDTQALLSYLHKHSPKARVIVVGDFWQKDNNVDQVKEKVCQS